MLSHIMKKNMVITPKQTKIYQVKKCNNKLKDLLKNTQEDIGGTMPAEFLQVFKKLALIKNSMNFVIHAYAVQMIMNNSSALLRRQVI